MVGIVIVCHSNKFAEGLLHELRMFSKTCPIAIAGGNDDNEYGTSFSKIKKAIEDVYSEDGVCIIADVGSSIMTAQMVADEFNSENIVIAKCPMLEGAIVSVISSEQGKSLKQIIESLPKLQEHSK